MNDVTRVCSLQQVLGNPACTDCSAYEVAPSTTVPAAANVAFTYWLMLMTSLMLSQTGKHCLEYTKVLPQQCQMGQPSIEQGDAAMNALTLQVMPQNGQKTCMQTSCSVGA